MLDFGPVAEDAEPVTTPSPSAAPSYAVGLRLKQVVLALGAAYLGIVALTNLVNLVADLSGSGWTFLNSGNADYVASIVTVYSWPGWFDEVAVLGALLVEGVGGPGCSCGRCSASAAAARDWSRPTRRSPGTSRSGSPSPSAPSSSWPTPRRGPSGS